LLKNVNTSRPVYLVCSKYCSQQIANLDNVSNAVDLCENNDRFIEEEISVIGEGVAPAVGSFEAMDLPQEVKHVLSSKGFTKPTSIQANALPVALSGRDLVGIAKTGCGKTLAFIVPAVVNVLNKRHQQRNESSPLAIVLAPTRELTQQIADVKNMAASFLNDYIQINVGSTDLHANPNIEQIIEICDRTQKPHKIVSLLKELIKTNEKVLIFAETKAKVDFLSRLLRGQRYPATGLHGDKTQLQRDMIMKDFRTGRCNVLVATDVASRG
ncbi:putative ATP-dependent RNA helicase DDX5-like protein, partial [Dinothrombium tinctorium]